MQPSIDFGAAFVTDAHSAHWLARRTAFSAATHGAHLQKSRRHGGSGAHMQAQAIDGDCKV
jgi:hypothetical protein